MKYEILKQKIQEWKDEGIKTFGDLQEYETYFTCEICHQKTPKFYEGAEPNVCENCLPIKEC
jgi:hypothetical protein